MNLVKIKKRATSSKFLKNRINFNKKYQKFDFSLWQYKNYKKIITKFIKKKDISNIRILDVGAGDGLQVSHFVKIFNNPEVWCLDYSKKSLNLLRQKYRSRKIKIYKLDMNNLNQFLKKNKLENYFHIAHSSYALYYAKNQNNVLRTMKNSLKKNGLFLISAPSEPHDMVNFINRINKISQKIIKTLKFFNNTLVPFLKKNGKNCLYVKKTNNLIFKKEEEFLRFWQNTTYYKTKIVTKVIAKLKNRKTLNFRKISGIAAAIKK